MPTDAPIFSKRFEALDKSPYSALRDVRFWLEQRKLYAGSIAGAVGTGGPVPIYAGLPPLGNLGVPLRPVGEITGHFRDGPVVVTLRNGAAVAALAALNLVCVTKPDEKG